MGLVFDESFFSSQPGVKSLLALFEHTPNVVFYAKDRRSRFVAANSAMMAARQVRDADEILGRSDTDFHPPTLAEAYIAEDRTVIESGVPLVNQSWFVIDHAGRSGWFRSSKTPLFGRGDRVIGLAGIRYAIATPEDRAAQFRNLAPAIQYLEENYTESIPTETLARLAKISVTQFNRRFDEVFRSSPRQFLLSLRIEKARHLLTFTEEPIGAISAQSGFYDQSHFTRHFRKLLGMTPIQYRKRFRSHGGG